MKEFCIVIIVSLLCWGLLPLPANLCKSHKKAFFTHNSQDQFLHWLDDRLKPPREGEFSQTQECHLGLMVALLLLYAIIT